MADEFNETPEDRESNTIPVEDQLSAAGDVDIPWGLFGAVLFVAILAVFVLQNTEAARVVFLWLEVELPLWTVIVAVVLVTIVIDQLFSYFYRRRRRRRKTAETEADA